MVYRLIIANSTQNAFFSQGKAGNRNTLLNTSLTPRNAKRVRVSSKTEESQSVKDTQIFSLYRRQFEENRSQEDKKKKKKERESNKILLNRP